MPIDLYCSLKKTSQWAFGSPFLNKVLGSSVFVAVVVAFIMILLLMIMYPAKSGTSFTIVIKMFVYMFFSTMLVIFLHDGVIKYMIEEEHLDNKSGAFMQNATLEGRARDPVYSDMYKPIVPVATGGDESIDEEESIIVEPVDHNSRYVSPFNELHDRGSLNGPKPKKEGGNPYK